MNVVTHTRDRRPGKIDSRLLGPYSPYSLYLQPTNYISTPYTTALSTFTMYTWIKLGPYLSSYGGEIISKRSYWATDMSDFPFALSVIGASPPYTVRAAVDSGTDWDTSLYIDSSISENVWHFLSVRWSGSVLTLDVDENKYTSTSTLSISSNSRPIYLGMPSFENAGGTGANRYMGYIHEFGFYSNVKSDEEIQSIRNRTYDTNSCLILYKMNEGTGTTLTDSSGNGRNGTISGAIWTTSVP